MACIEEDHACPVLNEKSALKGGEHLMDYERVKMSR